MSGVGFWELVLVFLIGLLVLGPERLPRVAHQLGTWLGQARRMTRMMKRQLEEELNLENKPAIRRSTPLPRPAETPERVEKPDTYSPAHDTDAPGTGVPGDDGTAQAPEDQEPADESKPLADPAEPPTQERVS